VTAPKSHAQHLRDKLVASRKENEKLILENAQLRNFQARAALNATETTLAQMDLRTEKALTDRWIATARKTERQRDFYWESTDLIREEIEHAQKIGGFADPTKLMAIIDRPDDEGLFE
jgi:hypothetical protein